MKSLLAKLEAATEGHWRLDSEVHVAAGGCLHTDVETTVYEDGNSYDTTTRCKTCGVDTYGASVPHYTTSLDAAMTLVPEGWIVGALRQGDNKLWTAELREGFSTSYGRVVIEPSAASYRGTTAPLALCIAALRTRGETE